MILVCRIWYKCTYRQVYFCTHLIHTAISSHTHMIVTLLLIVVVSCCTCGKLQWIQWSSVLMRSHGERAETPPISTISFLWLWVCWGNSSTVVERAFKRNNWILQSLRFVVTSMVKLDEDLMYHQAVISSYIWWHVAINVCVGLDWVTLCRPSPS